MGSTQPHDSFPRLALILIAVLMTAPVFCSASVPEGFGTSPSSEHAPVAPGDPQGATSPAGLTLPQTIRNALRYGAQARIARAARDVARAQAERDRPVARPTVTATASGTLQGPRASLPQSGFTDTADTVVLPERVGRLEVTLEQPLYRAGMGAARNRYRFELSAGELEYRRALTEIVLTVRKAYIDVLRAEEGVRRAQDGMNAASRYQTLVIKQIDSGLARPIDAATAAGQAAEAGAGLRQAEGGLALARSNLNRLQGRGLEVPIAVVAISAPPVPPADVARASDYAMQHRPEILLLEHNLQAAMAGVALARSQSQPSLSARGHIAEQTPTALMHEHYYAATLQVQWPLMDGGKTRQDTREALAQVNHVKALLDDAREGIQLEVVRAREVWREARDRVASTRLLREAAEAAARVAEKAYEVGKGTALEVQAAQRETRSASAKELEALYDQLAGYADFQHAEGTLLDGIDLSEERR